MNLARLSRMGIGEIAGRSRQEASKWRDLVLGFVPGATRSAAEGFSEARWRAAGWSSFFEGATAIRTPELLAERLPEAATAILRAADAVLDGSFDLLGYRGLHFGDPIHWGLDPVSGREAPIRHWSRIHPLDSSEVGDSKVVWELGRQQWLVTLAQAPRLSGWHPYAAGVGRHVRAFLRANPPGTGIHWASSLEVALRLVAWAWVVALLRHSSALSAELFGQMAAGIAAHARHVESYLSRYFSPNTHLTGEALGIFYAGVLFPELPRAARWREQGARILVEQCERQVLPDGVYFEQASGYQRYTVEIYLHFLILAARARIPVPASVEERLQRMLDFLLAVRRPDGRLPQIGDADGGWLLPLVPREPDDLRGVFGVAATLFGRSDYAWAAGGPVPEVLWLLGPAGLRSFEELTLSFPEAKASRLFPDGGYAVMASGWEGDGHQLIFDVGPLGCPISAGHGHADLLAIQCSAFGEAFLVDPGTFVYTPQPKWRDHFRSSLAHNTLIVDGASQADPRGPFSWKNRPRARLRRWVAGAAYDLADAEHDAYRRLSPPVVHRRRVLFVKPRYWVLADDLLGEGTRRVELRFQLAPLAVERLGSSGVRARGGNGHRLHLQAFGRTPLDVSVHEGETEPPLGWVSPDYGCRVPAPMVVFSVVAPLPLRILTLLHPVAAGEAPPEVTPLSGDEAGPSGLVVSGETVLLREDDVAITAAS